MTDFDKHQEALEAVASLAFQIDDLINLSLKVKDVGEMLGQALINGDNPKNKYNWGFMVQEDLIDQLNDGIHDLLDEAMRIYQQYR